MGRRYVRREVLQCIIKRLLTVGFTPQYSIQEAGHKHSQPWTTSQDVQLDGLYCKQGKNTNLSNGNKKSGMLLRSGNGVYGKEKAPCLLIRAKKQRGRGKMTYIVGDHRSFISLVGGSIRQTLYHYAEVEEKGSLCFQLSTTRR